MAKGNVKTVRISDELLEMIESQAGDNFTAKFEALVTRCMWELPKKEQELKDIQEQIDYQRKRLNRIRENAIDLDQRINQIDRLTGNYISQIKHLARDLETYK